jgi:hypothetical protein
MNGLKHRLNDVIRKLTGPQPVEPANTGVLPFLENLLKSLERGDRGAVRLSCDRLREYWLQSVAWCSDVSRDIERLLIDIEESDSLPDDRRKP